MRQLPGIPLPQTAIAALTPRICARSPAMREAAPLSGEREGQEAPTTGQDRSSCGAIYHLNTFSILLIFFANSKKNRLIGKQSSVLM